MEYFIISIPIQNNAFDLEKFDICIYTKKKQTKQNNHCIILCITGLVYVIPLFFISLRQLYKQNSALFNIV